MLLGRGGQLPEYAGYHSLGFVFRAGFLNFYCQPQTTKTFIPDATAVKFLVVYLVCINYGPSTELTFC